MKKNLFCKAGSHSLSYCWRYCWTGLLFFCFSLEDCDVDIVSAAVVDVDVDDGRH